MKNQTIKAIVIASLGTVVLSGCGQQEVDYERIANVIDGAVAESVKTEFLLNEKRNKQKIELSTSTYEDDLKLIQFKAIEYPRFANIVAFNMDSSNGLLDVDSVAKLKDALSKLEADLYLQTFYSALKESAGFTKEVVELNTANRFGYRIRNTFDMVVPKDSYFAENFPQNGRILVNEELVPYPECKESYKPFLLHTPLYPVGESQIEPFDITIENETKGWRVLFDGYRAMIDLACIPEDDGTQSKISELLAE